MGLFVGKEAKGAQPATVEGAQRAWDSGERVFVAKLIGGLREDAPDGWGRTIGAVEAMGWRLDGWSVSDYIGWAVFRR